MTTNTIVRQRGVVLDRVTLKPLAGARVDARDADGQVENVVARGVTDAQGFFEIRMTEEEIAALFGGRSVNLNFVVTHNGFVVADTQGTIRFLPGQVQPLTKIYADTSSTVTPAADTFVVSGRILEDGSGSPALVDVKIYDVGMAGDVLLASQDAIAMPAHYSLSFTADLIIAGKRLPDLRVDVWENRGALLNSSEIRFQAAPATIIDVAVNPAEVVTTSEQQDTTSATAAIVGGTALRDLTDAQLGQVAQSAEISLSRVRAISKADGIATSFSGPIASEGLYGLQRQGMPETKEELLAVRPLDLRIALERSAGTGEIGLSAAEVATQVANLRAEAVTSATGTGSFDELLTVAGLSAADRNTLLTAYMAHEGSSEDFRSTIGIGAAARQAAQTYLRAGAVVRYHVPLLQALANDGTWSTFEDLAGFDEAKWIALMAGISLPAGLAGANDTERKQSYATLITRIIESAIPTRFMAARIPATDERKTFLDNNTGFDFRKHRVATYFETASPNLTGITDVDALKTSLAKTERLLKLTPRWAHIDALEQAGFGSSRSIARYGRARFVADHGTALDSSGNPAVAEALYAQAVRQSGKAAHVFAKLNPGINGPGTPYVGSYDSPPTGPGSASAAWETYAGHPAQCACHRCAAIHGPLAYLVALLVWLNQFLAAASKTGGTATARDLLLGAPGLNVGGLALAARRPDIGYLELTCDNADGVLPYIDVANEILEWRVSGTLPSVAIGTGGTTEERLAAPEIINEAAFLDAYAKLDGRTAGSVVYPFVLPWSLWLAQTRIYLSHLGVERHALMRRFQIPSGPTNAAIALEQLGVHDVAWRIVTDGVLAGFSSADFWGMGGNPTWVADLKNAATITERAGITYEQLVELLETYMVRDPMNGHTSDPQLAPHPATVHCDLSKISITGVDSTNEQLFFEWMQSFVRMHHVLGLRFADLDKLFRVIATSRSFDHLITVLAKARSLEAELSIPLVEALAFWDTIDDFPMPKSALPTLVDRLFRSQSAGPLTNDKLPSPLSGTISAHANTIRGGLRVDAAAFASLTSADAAAALVLESPVATDTLDAQNLTTLFRYARLARALRLGVDELMVFVALTATEAFGSTSEPGELVREIRAFDAAGLNADEIHYLVRHVERPRAGVPSRAEEIAEHATALEDVTEAALAATKAPEKVALEDLRAELFAALDEATPDGEDLDARSAKLAADTDYLLGLATDLEILPTDAPIRRMRIQAILGDVFADTTPFEQFLVPEHPKVLTSCRVWCDGMIPYDNETANNPWPNQAPGTATVDQTTEGLEPTKATGPFGGVAFNGVDQFLDVTLSYAGTGHTFAVAAAPVATTAEQTILEVPSKLRFTAQTTTAGQVGYAFGALATWQDVGSVTWGMQTLTFRLDGTAPETGYVYRNGEPIATSAGAFSEGLTFSNATLGGSAGAGFFNGVIFAFGIFEGALGTTDLARVNGFLALLQQREQDRIAFLYRALRDHVHRREVEAAAKKRASERLHISEALGAHILARLNGVKTPLDDATSLLDSLRPASVGGHRFPDAGADEAERIDALTRMSKVAMLANKLAITLTDLDWLLARAEPGWLDLNELPVAAPVDASDLPSASARYAALLRLVDIYALAKHFVDGRDGMYDLAAGAAEASSAATFFADVAAQTRWEAADLLSVHDRFHTDLGPYEDLTGFIPVVPAAEAVRKLGVSATVALGWLDPAESELLARDTAREALKAARAKHTAEGWNDIAPDLRDLLRELQRKALVAHLVQVEGLANSDALYDALLIDVEMSACQKISRVKAALNSVQLFIHRALLGLEPLLTLDKDARAQWEWKKIFTLWEANRKVFLYPENWVEPELRDDKTPLFAQLEADLRQGDLTDDRIERAYNRYLRGLEEIAQVEPVGIFHEQQAATNAHPSVDALHVFAQTPGGAPRALYQRRFVNGRYWTPWEPVPLEANARSFLPIVRGGRKHLFWLEATDAFDAGDAPKEGAEPKDADVRLKIAGSSFDGFEWSKAQTIDLGSHPKAAVPDQLVLYFVASVDSSANDFLVVGTYPGWTDISGSHKVVNGKWQLVTVQNQLPLISCSIEPCSGALRVETATPDYPPQALSSTDGSTFGALHQAKELTIAGPQQGVITVLTNTPGVATRCDLTYWSEGSALLNVPRAHFLSNTASHWLFVSTTPAPSVDPSDYVEPPNVLVPGSEEVSAEQVGDVQPSSYNVKLKPLKIALADLDTAVADPPMESAQPAPALVQPKVRIRSFDHRLVCRVREVLHRHGLAGLRDYHRLAPPLQELEGPSFFTGLGPVPSRIVGDYPKDHFDFAFGGAYSTYNWEIFFHIPLFIASRLRHEGRYQEALEWIHGVFDPREAAGAGDYIEVWKFRPFRELLDVSALKAEVDGTAISPFGKWLQHALGVASATSGTDEDFEAQLDASEEDPFNPHRIARMRPAAYQKYVVRLYVETLIDWGDKLFRRDTIESLIEAQQLYMLAGLVLGPQPPVVEAPLSESPKTFFDIEGQLDAFDNPIVAVEALVPAGGDGPANQPSPAIMEVPILLFCVPPNERMRELWDLVQDRLFKLRNCMNIEGVVRELPLFQPPIDPALLVRARAAGLDIDSILSDLYAPPPLHRFGVLYGRAVDFASFVVSLGQSLLSALEKKDSETLALLQSEQQVTLLERIRETRRAQIEEAQANIAALRASRATAEQRLGHYEGVIAKGLLPSEEGAQQKNERASELQETASMLELGAQMLHLIPDLNLGAAGMGPANFISFGGTFFANALRVQSAALTMQATQARDRAAALSVAAGYTRRLQDWELQREQTALELAAIDKQLIAAEVRVAIAQHELDTHELQIEQSKQIQAFYEQKFTREELYTWMAGELSGLYYDAYKLAFDMARRAERAFQFERAAFDRRFIQFGHWEGSRKGLLAGERLLLELRRVDAAYLDSDRREREITKHFSLAEMHPDALLTLRETGSVDFALTEDFFDLDYPGHYMRRIKSVSITLPAVTGPYSGVHATLTLLSNKIRTSPAIGNGYEEGPPDGDSRFLYNYGAIQSICTSLGQNDAGVFELRFDGERLLPFEGAGAVSKWRLEIPQSDNRFDLSTLTDAVIHIQYMARDAGGQLRIAARDAVSSKYNTAMRLVSARYELPDAWQAFMDGEANGDHILTFTLDGRLPFIPGTGDVGITKVAMAANFEPGTITLLNCAFDPATTLNQLVEANGVIPWEDLSSSPAPESQTWTLTINSTNWAALLDPEDLLDIFFIFDLRRGALP